MNKLDQLIKLIHTTPEAVAFHDVIKVIDEYYDYTPVNFSNGSENDRVMNKAGNNEGSCKIFSFAKIQNLDEKQTLNCFGHYYREDVLKHPESNDHANIRTFIRYGWQQINFETDALKDKTT